MTGWARSKPATIKMQNTNFNTSHFEIKMCTMLQYISMTQNKPPRSHCLVCVFSRLTVQILNVSHHRETISGKQTSNYVALAELLP